MARMKWEQLLKEDHVGASKALEESLEETGYWRSTKKTISTEPTEIDESYQRLVASSPVRALQDKTQVFALDSSDFIRTRLTHSMEVSAIAERLIDAIGVKLRDEDKPSFGGSIRDMRSVMRTAGLLHDMGNPPFGHVGEEVIKGWVGENLEALIAECLTADGMSDRQKRDLTIFEGNSQAIRILLRKDSFGDMADLSVSKAVIGSMAKYTTCAAVYERPSGFTAVWNHKPGVYYSEWNAYLDICSDLGIISGHDANAWKVDPSLASIPRHPLAFVLEAADDIAYATADFEDAYEKGLISRKAIEAYGELLEKVRKKWDDDNGMGRTWPFKDDSAISAFDSLIKLLDMSEMPDSSFDGRYAVHAWMRRVREHLIYAAAFQFSFNYDRLLKGEFKGELLLANKHDIGQGMDGYPASEVAPLVLLLKMFASAYAHVSDDVKNQDLLAKRFLTRLLDQLSRGSLAIAGLTADAGHSPTDALMPASLVKVVEEHRKREDDESERFYQVMRSVLDYVSLLTDSKAKELAEAYEQILGPRELIAKN